MRRISTQQVTDVVIQKSVRSADSAEGHAALAEAYLEAKDADGARAEAERSLRLDPATAAARRVLDRLERR